MMIQPDQIDQMTEWDAKLELRRLIKHHVDSRVELATLRAKAEAYDKGAVLFGLVDSQGAVISASPDHSGNLNSVELPYKILDGLYLRKVKVCEVVEDVRKSQTSEKPALATNEK